MDDLTVRLSGPCLGNRDASGPAWRSGGSAELAIKDVTQKRPRPLARRLSVGQRTALVAAFESGVEQKNLAVQYGISVRSVKRLIRAAGDAGAAALHT